MNKFMRISEAPEGCTAENVTSYPVAYKVTEPTLFEFEGYYYCYTGFTTNFLLPSRDSQHMVVEQSSGLSMKDVLSLVNSAAHKHDIGI